MVHVSEDKVSIREFLSEGLKLAVLAGLLGLAFFLFSVFGCNHGACHAPATWKPALEFFGR
jgi:hypothetical protein